MSDDRDDDRGGGRRRFRRRPTRGKGMGLKHVNLDYKQPESLRRYMTEHGRIRPRRQTGLSATAQRRLAREVKRARHLALLPFVDE